MYAAADVIEDVGSRLIPPLTPEERARRLSGNRSLRSSEKQARTQVRDTVRLDAKTEWLQKHISERVAGRYSLEKADTEDENTIGAGVNVTVDWLAGQVERAFRVAGSEPTVAPGMVAASLLASHDTELCRDLRNVPPSELSLDRIVAHLLWLQYPLPPRVVGSVARRLYIALANREIAPRTEAEQTRFCAECGETVPEGELCGCDR